MRASSRELLVPFFTPLVWCGGDHHRKWEIDNFKIKIVTFIINFGRNNIIRNEQMQASVSEVLVLLSWSSEGYI